jgi:hypothetical protein
MVKEQGAVAAEERKKKGKRKEMGWMRRLATDS